MQRDKLRHQWSGPEAKAGTRLTDGCLDVCYGKPTPKRGPLHESHWPKPVEKGKGESREMMDWGKEKGGCSGKD